MSQPTSTKPYMIRAIYEWCVDNGYTPHLLVMVDDSTRVPMGYVKNGEIVLNINYSATKDLLMNNDVITFSARFNGVSHDIYAPVNSVRAIFARENGQGVFFEADTAEQGTPAPVKQSTEESTSPDDTPPPTAGKKPSLRLVK